LFFAHQIMTPDPLIVPSSETATRAMAIMLGREPDFGLPRL
jgi:hypothetical protein